LLEIRFSEAQARCLSPLWDRWLQSYFQRRYGASWLWYWLNWQLNRELLF
jgi:hypothetical protein